MQDDMPEGYSLIPPDHPQGGPRGLRLGSPGILATAADCWHARVLNKGRRLGEPRFLWIWEQDPRAVQRYRRRAWAAVRGAPPPGDRKFCAACGNPHCLNPAHLRLIQRPPAPRVEPPRGRWEWVGEGEDETFVFIPEERSPRPGRTPKPRPEGARAPRNHTANRKRGEGHYRAKLTAEDVHAIRAATGVTQVELAARYGITAAAVRRILSRRTWAHVV